MAQSLEQMKRVVERTSCWQYLTILITWDTELQQWRSDWPGSSPHHTFDGILDQAGAMGWELVSFLPFTALIFDLPIPTELNQRFWAPKDYHAIFKRHKPQDDGTER